MRYDEYTCHVKAKYSDSIFAIVGVFALGVGLDEATGKTYIDISAHKLNPETKEPMQYNIPKEVKGIEVRVTLF